MHTYLHTCISTLSLHKRTSTHAQHAHAYVQSLRTSTSAMHTKTHHTDVHPQTQTSENVRVCMQNQRGQSANVCKHMSTCARMHARPERTVSRTSATFCMHARPQRAVSQPSAAFYCVAAAQVPSALPQLATGPGGAQPPPLSAPLYTQNTHTRACLVFQKNKYTHKKQTHA